MGGFFSFFWDGWSAVCLLFLEVPFQKAVLVRLHSDICKSHSQGKCDSLGVTVLSFHGYIVQGVGVVFRPNHLKSSWHQPLYWKTNSAPQEAGERWGLGCKVYSKKIAFLASWSISNKVIHKLNRVPQVQEGEQWRVTNQVWDPINIPIQTERAKVTQLPRMRRDKSLVETPRKRSIWNSHHALLWLHLTSLTGHHVVCRWPWMQLQNPLPLSLNSCYQSIQDVNCYETVGRSQWNCFSYQISAWCYLVRHSDHIFLLPRLHHQCHLYLSS